MKNNWEIKNSTQTQQSEQKICFFCKRYYGSDYHSPHIRLLCSGVLPQWDFLRFLMREVKPTDTCCKFARDKER